MEVLKEIWTVLIAFAGDWGELTIAGISLVIAVIALIKSSKAEKLQNRVNEMEIRIKEYELERIAKEKEEAYSSCVEARVITIGKGKHRLKVWNSGNTTAYNVTAKFDGDPRIPIMDREKQPYDELAPNKSYEMVLVVHSGSASKFRIITEWMDEEGKQQTKSQMGDL